MTTTLTPRERELARHAPRLTKRLLDAILEALVFRMAGEIGENGIPARDYDDASVWAAAQLRKRTRAGSEAAPEPGETLDEEDFK